MKKPTISTVGPYIRELERLVRLGINPQTHTCGAGGMIQDQCSRCQWLKRAGELLEAKPGQEITE